MMRVFQFAGFDIMASDKHQTPVNEVDPHGVLELDNVKEIQDHPPEWTSNKVIKIVVPYIHLLPVDRSVKVVFMLRPISEIVVSLLVQRTVWEADPYTHIELARKYIESKGVPVHFVHYHDLVKYPKSTIAGIAEFLEVDIDIEKAAKGVEKDPRAVAKFDKTKIIKAGKEGFYEGPQDIMVLNDPNYEVSYVPGNPPTA